VKSLFENIKSGNLQLRNAANLKFNLYENEGLKDEGQDGKTKLEKGELPNVKHFSA